MKDTTSHWYEVTIPSLPDSNGSSIVGYKRIEVRPDKYLRFIITRKANDDFVISCDQSNLAATNLTYRDRTIYAAQAQAMPSQVIWSIIVEGVKSLQVFRRP